MIKIESKKRYNVLVSYDNGKGDLVKWINITLNENDICSIKDYFKKHMTSDSLIVTIHDIKPVN